MLIICVEDGCEVIFEYNLSNIPTIIYSSYQNKIHLNLEFGTKAYNLYLYLNITFQNVKTTGYIQI